MLNVKVTKKNISDGLLADRPTSLDPSSLRLLLEHGAVKEEASWNVGTSTLTVQKWVDVTHECLVHLRVRSYKDRGRIHMRHVHT